MNFKSYSIIYHVYFIWKINFFPRKQSQKKINYFYPMALNTLKVMYPLSSWGNKHYSLRINGFIYTPGSNKGQAILQKADTFSLLGLISPVSLKGSDHGCVSENAGEIF